MGLFNYLIPSPGGLLSSYLYSVRYLFFEEIPPFDVLSGKFPSLLDTFD